MGIRDSSKEAKAAEKTLKIEERRLKIVKKLKNEEWEDIIDEFDIDELTEGYVVTDIWEID